MRVYQFITLFLALGIACGCSHRRAQYQPVAEALCGCSTCRSAQEQMIGIGAVPSDHFEGSVPEAALPASETAVPQPATSEQGELSPEYTNDSGSKGDKASPFSSGNPVEMDQAPQQIAPPQFNIPAVDMIEAPPKQLPQSTLELTPSAGSPVQDSSESVFQPFNRDLFKVKNKTNSPIPLEQQPSILIEKVSETTQPDLGFVTPPTTSKFEPSFSEPSSNDFKIPDSITAVPAEVEPRLPEVDTRKPPVDTVESASSFAMPDFAAKSRTLVPDAIQPTETVVQGQLFANPVVLYARPQQRQRVASQAQAPRTVQPATIQKPVEHQEIVENSQLDPVYGLPLNNQVQFNSLPTIIEPQFAPVATEAQHLHVHIHHDYGNNAGVVQGPVAYQNGQPASNVQVVYRDDKGRVVMAPPTPTTGVAATVPTGDQRTYYVPPKQILRLKAVSPIDQPRSNPSVASIQMRDTVVYGGTHLLNKPEYQAQAVQTNHGLPGIDHEKLRAAFKTSPSGNSLR